MTKVITWMCLIKAQSTPKYQASDYNQLQLAFVPDLLQKKQVDDT